MQKDILLTIKIWASIFAFAYLQAAKAAYYDVLPKGVRLLAYRYVTTSDIKSSFTGNKQEVNFDLKQEIKPETLENINDAAKNYFATIKALSPEAYKAFSLGEFQAHAQAQIKAQGIGMAYGFNKRVTAYVSVPYYSGNVNINMVRTKKNNLDKVLTDLEKNNSDEATLLADFTRQLPEANGELLQSIITNYFGYKPIGNWKGQALGDVEIGAIYQLGKNSISGNAMTLGMTLPTGREDDPDTLQDLPFGDGQFDLFLEYGGGVALFKYKVELDSAIRYTYQAPASKSLRIVENEDYPLSKNKGTFQEKLGDKIDLISGIKYLFNDWAAIRFKYLYNYTFKSQYHSGYRQANSILAKNTDKESHTIGAEILFSSVNLFKQGHFKIPADFNISAQKIINGKNIPQYTRFDFEIRLYF